MHLALEVISKVAESPQEIDQSRDFTYDVKNSALPPVCALSLDSFHTIKESSYYLIEH